MKRTITLILALILCLSLAACGKEGKNSTVTDGRAVTTNTETATDTIPVAPTADPISLGDTISLDYAELTLDTFEISGGYNFEYTDNSSAVTVTKKASLDCTSGMKLICLRGSFTNKAKSEVYPANDPVAGKLIINGYEYETSMRCYIADKAESMLGVVPMQTVDCYIYAEIPETLASEIETCELYLGLVKDLDSSVWVDDMSDYDVLYLLETMPTV